jgi:hypothetical protein
MMLRGRVRAVGQGETGEAREIFELFVIKEGRRVFFDEKLR